MKKVRAFTLIELLIVVAIIAILAAIAVPNFLEAQVRSKTSRARSDMRSLATGLESYYLDNNCYPAYTTRFTRSVDSYLPGANTGANFGATFRLRNATSLSTLTTPVAYITSYFSDPFNDARGASFRYYSPQTPACSGWILGSFGPDTDLASGGSLNWDDIQDEPAGGSAIMVPTVGDPAFQTGGTGGETVYNPSESQPSLLLLTGSGPNGAYTYDPTNGTISSGDVWRVRQ